MFRPVFAKLVTFGRTVATCEKFVQFAFVQRSILKPSSFPALSVQDKFICDAEMVAADRPDGEFGVAGVEGRVVAFAEFE